ncbi:STAS domain-containing protein [Umezawaea endophytica]|uniref:Anti-sigma factor antagonist n=1 Tax=Umezawaea endophytica TaxID=1654476 RepID=A0A9X2VGA8_9PSEU|nr:STAS domain-containing protein [Umezawaea endophytica]MCS7475909.1 STAS domain-containing protein [Umezawaea endophytica]
MGEFRSPEEQITVDFTMHGEISVVCVAGEVDMTTSTSVGETLRTLLEYRPTALVLDLTETDYFGSGGLAILIDTVERTTRAGVGFAVASGRACVLRPLRVTKVDTVVRVYPDTDAALRALELALSARAAG